MITTLVAAGGEVSTEFNAVDVFVVLLIGLGPVKAALVYLGSTSQFEPPIRRRIAMKAVLVAGVVAIALFLLGAGLAQLLHFSAEALAIAGGLVLLILGIRMILSQGGGGHDAEVDVDPDAVAIFPLALPLLLNPVGIVALFTLSGTLDFEQGLVTIGLIIGVLVVDIIVFLLLARARPLNPQVVSVVEIVLGFLLAALAVELVLSALSDASVITFTPGS